MLIMKSLYPNLLFVGIVAALLKPYEQCGGLGWTTAYECEAGYSCKTAGTDAFPNYQCYPDVGPIIPHIYPYGQCGGQGFQNSGLCSFGWDCVVINQYFSQCQQNADYVPPAVSPTPNLAGPGTWCGPSAIAREVPDQCVPGFTCTGPGVWGFWVCTSSQGVSISVPSTTLKTSTTGYTSTTTSSKSATKSSSKTSTKTSMSTKSTIGASPTNKLF